MKKEPRNIRTYAAAACILLGLLILMFPHCRERYDEVRRQKIMEQWQASLADLDAPDGGTAHDADVGGKVAGDGSDGDAALGILRIQKIDLEQPVLAGAGREHLDISLATIEPTGTPGKTGNFAVAGHNSRIYGRHFNRLSELAAGDAITVDTADGSYTYVVQELYTVQPDEVWVLESTAKKAEITLVTCYYPADGGATERLVVKGILEQ